MLNVDNDMLKKVSAPVLLALVLLLAGSKMIFSA
jgi:hypothetical protein